MKDLSVIISATLFICLIGRNKSDQLKKYNDPYLDSFRGRDIQYLISFDPEDPILVDTATFDHIGNIVSLKVFGLDERRSYDSLNFMTRVLRINDTPSNEVINYHFDKDGFLIQEWNQINHLEWSFKNSDIKKILRAIKFKIDGEGRITEEIDSIGNQSTLFIYDKNELLVGKEIYSIIPKNLLYR